MENYKRSLIDLVRDRPLIWDPQHEDYKNKDQRNQVWEMIERVLPSPTGENMAKETWDQLTRGFCNALKRKDKRSGSGAVPASSKWRFEEDMMFLLPVKRLRTTTCNLGPEAASFEDDLQDVGGQDMTLEAGRGNEVALRDNGMRKRRAQESEDTRSVLDLIKERQALKQAESPRMSFFRSLLPVVESFDDQKFMAYQMAALELTQTFSRLPLDTESHNRSMPPSWDGASSYPQ